MSDLLSQLQALRLKGRADAASLSGAWDVSEDEARKQLAALEAEGLVDEKKGWYGLSAAGETRRVEALNTERSTLDTKALGALYDAFCAVNADFKKLVTDVQLGQLEPQAAPGALGDLHRRFAPLATDVGEAIPRLARYPARFETALNALTAGDPRFLASPLVESYHTLWFELHEELIQALGRTRADEAAAGRA